MKRLFFSLEYFFTWLFRFRHRRGYNVHSPFAFKFIKEVLFERSPYYAYKDIKEKRKNSSAKEPLRIDKLLFRLSNNIQPNHIVVFGKNSENANYALHKGCLKADVTTIENEEFSTLNNFFKTNNDKVFLYIHHTKDILTCYNCFKDYLNSDSVIIVKDLGRKKSLQKWWKEMEKDKNVKVCFNLYYVGIIFFYKKLNKQNYKICY